MKRTLPALIIVAGLASLYPMQRWIDSSQTAEDPQKEILYLSSGNAIRRMSLGLEGLVSDIYWIRTVQYFGRKIIDSERPLSSSSTKDMKLDLLAPLLKIIVTLDPQNIPPYRFGAMFLPERDPAVAIELLEKGIQENPNEWRLYQDIAYIYWQNGASSGNNSEDFNKAAYWYDRGSNIPGAPWWMHDLSGLMTIKGGSREAARAVYQGYTTSDDPHIRAEAYARLHQIQASEELEVINSLLLQYKSQIGSCPATLQPLASRLRALKFALDDDLLPLDPQGFRYAYDRSTCKADLSTESTVPRM